MTTFTESCKPQDEDGLLYWIKSRLETFDAGEVIASTYADGADVDVSNPVVVPPVPTQAELDKVEWFKNYNKWVKVKTTLIDTGILVGNETKVTALKTKVQTDFTPVYLDLL